MPTERVAPFARRRMGTMSRCGRIRPQLEPERMRYEELGRRIDEAWDRACRDERKFPEVACAALSSFEPEAFDLHDIGRFLLDTTIPQQPETGFSNLPVTVYHGDGFHLELLVWTRSSTSVHQHGFSGAFRVVAGSSLHSDFRVVERQRITSHLLIADIDMVGMRLLKTGDVVPIVAGRHGLVHALFHLDEPSVTLVARTTWETDAGPQFSLIQPHFAFDALWAESDKRIAIVDRWFGVIDNIGEQGIPQAALDRMIDLNPARLFAIVLHHAERFSDDVFAGGFQERLETRHPYLAAGLADTARLRRHERSLLATRTSIKEPDLRFLIALLL